MTAVRGMGGGLEHRRGEFIRPDEPWDLGHDDLDRSLPRAPEHRRCNRATRAHAAKRRKRGSRLYGPRAEQGMVTSPEDPNKADRNEAYRIRGEDGTVRVQAGPINPSRHAETA